MRLRSIVAAIAAGLVGTVAANRVLADRTGPLAPALSGDRRTYRWRGFDVSYVEAGDPDAPDVVLLHGLHAAASAREFRSIFGALAGSYHVIAPDLPGFGTSDRPAVVYDAALYEGFLREFVEEAADEPTVVASSLTGSYAAQVAADVPVAGLVLINPTDETGPRNVFVQELFRSPVVGEGLFNLLVSRPSIRYYDRDLAFADPEHVDDEVIDYQWRTAHQPNARYAPASFVGGFLDPSVPFAESLPKVAEAGVPVTIVCGREANRPGVEYARTLADAADATLAVVSRASLLVHDEQPDAFLDAVSTALPRLERD